MLIKRNAQCAFFHPWYLPSKGYTGLNKVTVWFVKPNQLPSLWSGSKEKKTAMAGF